MNLKSLKPDPGFWSRLRLASAFLCMIVGVLLIVGSACLLLGPVAAGLIGTVVALLFAAWKK